MNDFMNGLFANTSTSIGINLVNDDNNRIINEAIILDKLNGNKEALLEFYNEIGKYGARDGLLNESAQTDIKLASFDDSKCAECASVLTIAKESGAKEYDVYQKALMLMNACMDEMRNKYGNRAAQRVEAQTSEIESNPRVMDAISVVQDACCKKC